MRPRGIEVRRDITAAMLRKRTRSEKDGRVAARMLGIANILDGMDRASAAQAAGMDRQTLCDWVHRYNKEGLSGLRNRSKGRPQRALTPQQEREVDALVAKEPQGASVRWRRADVKAEIEKRYGVTLHEASVGRLLRRLGFARLTVRPIHPENDPEAMEAFKKTSRRAWRKSSPHMRETKLSSFGSRTKLGSGKKAH